MKELMLRLIKDGKIVGYMYGWYDDVIKRYNYYMFDNIADTKKVPWVGNCSYPIDCMKFDHNSFDYGIKFGDEWWFENDIIKMNTNVYDDSILQQVRNCGFIGKVVRDNKCSMFRVKEIDIEDGCNVWFGNLDMYKPERIGNIYE